MRLMELARWGNRFVKERRRLAMARHLSPVRRIERVYPPSNDRIVSLTFDDGPSAAPPSSGGAEGLTQKLLEILAFYGAKGTFDIIGTTANNYPDRVGKLHSPQWGGVKHDHYPEFGRDEQAGAVNQLRLVEAILAGGHELSNHCYSHVAFGPSRLVYGSRSYLPNLGSVIMDVRRLHDLIRENFDFTMRLGRPPHYIDRTADNYNSYDVYRELGYNYLAASFDGGGWKPTLGSYRQDVEAMVEPLRRALKANPGSLNGQVIFHKDGYNMSKQTPVVDALPQQLELLKSHGYRVVTVTELMSISPYIDFPDSEDIFPVVRELAALGVCLGYRDNSFQPDRVMTVGELAQTLVGGREPGTGREVVAAARNPEPFMVKQSDRDTKSHPYAYALGLAMNLGVIDNDGIRNADRPLDLDRLTRVKGRLADVTGESYKLEGRIGKGRAVNPRAVTRREAFRLLGPLLVGLLREKPL